MLRQTVYAVVQALLLGAQGWFLCGRSRVAKIEAIVRSGGAGLHDWCSRRAGTRCGGSLGSVARSLAFFVFGAEIIG